MTVLGEQNRGLEGHVQNASEAALSLSQAAEAAHSPCKQWQFLQKDIEALQKQHT